MRLGAIEDATEYSWNDGNAQGQGNFIQKRHHNGPQASKWEPDMLAYSTLINLNQPNHC